MTSHFGLANETMRVKKKTKKPKNPKRLQIFTSPCCPVLSWPSTSPVENTPYPARHTDLHHGPQCCPAPPQMQALAPEPCRDLPTSGPSLGTWEVGVCELG